MILYPTSTLCAFSLSGGRPRTYRDFLGLVAAIRARLRENVCTGSLTVRSQDRYLTAASVFASVGLGLKLRVSSISDPGDPTSAAKGSDSGAKNILLCPTWKLPLDLSQLEREGRPSELPPFEFDEFCEHPWIELCTSGSTGTPIVIAKSARQLFVEALSHKRWLAVSTDARVALTVFPEHIYGLLFGVLLPIIAGASFCRETPQHGASILAMAATFRATILVGVPAHLRVLLSALEPAAGTELDATVRTIISSGARLYPELARAFADRGVRVIDILGSTETGGIAWREPSHTEVYRPFAGIRVQASSAGALILNSPFLSTLDDVECQDRISMFGDGFHYLGRSDRIVKVGGSRVSLDEITSAARMIPGVADAVAFAKEEADAMNVRGHVVYLVVVSSHIESAALWRTLRVRLKGPSVPRFLRVVPELPVDERGKVSEVGLESLFEPPTNSTPA